MFSLALFVAVQKKPPIKDTFSSVSSFTENVGAVRLHVPKEQLISLMI